MSRRIVLLLTLAACGGSTVMSTEGYDQSCIEANDCNAVFVGDVCGCSCEVDAINASEQTLWAQERSAKQDRCDRLLDCAACPDLVVACVDDVCSAGEVPP